MINKRRAKSKKSKLRQRKRSHHPSPSKAKARGKARNTDQKPSNPIDLEQYYSQNGALFGGADILCLGAGRASERIATLIKILLSARDELGKCPIARILVLVPPGHNKREAESSIMANFGNSIREARGQALSRQEKAILRKRIHFECVPDRESGSVLTFAERAENQAAMIVLDAAAYRADGVQPYVSPGATSPTLPEDVWVPHLQKLAKDSVAVAKRRHTYVALDAGEFSPNRDATSALLCSVDRCGVVGLRTPQGTAQVVAHHVDRWFALIAEGRVGVVLKEIETNLLLGTDDKALLRVQMLSKAGLHSEALLEIDSVADGHDKPDVDVLVKLARIAEDGDASTLANRLLSPIIEDIYGHEALTIALTVAIDIESSLLETRAMNRLEKLFPSSSALQQRRIEKALAQRNYRAAADIVRKSPNDPDLGLAGFYDLVADQLDYGGVPNYARLLTDLSDRDASWQAWARIACGIDALHRGLLPEALELVQPICTVDKMSPSAIRLLLDIIERVFLARSSSGALLVDRADLSVGIIHILRYLALNPSDGGTRTRLARILSVQVSGSLGIVFAVRAMLEFAGHQARPKTAVRRRTPSAKALAARKPFFQAAFAWLGEQSPIVLGRCKLPSELIEESPDEVLHTILDLLQRDFGSAENDYKALQNWLLLATAIAPHTSDPDQDILAVRLVATRLAAYGRAQLARDFAEQLLHQASSPRRARLAWAATADIYHRSGNRLEALIAMGCALVSNDKVEVEQFWHEMATLIRLLRDLGLFEFATSIIRSSRARFSDVRFGGAILRRLDTLELQLQYAWSLTRENLTAIEYQKLFDLAISVGDDALNYHDEAAPIALILGQIIRSASTAGFLVPAAASTLFDRLQERAGPSALPLVRAFSAAYPRASEVVALLRKTENARYSEDAGYDARTLAMAAERLLSGSEARHRADITTFGIELLSDRATAVPGWETVAAPPRTPNSIAEVSAAARSLSKKALSVVMAGFDSGGCLVHVTARKGKFSRPIREPAGGLSLARLRSWEKELPYNYGTIEPGSNLFYTSTESFEIAQLPTGNILFVSDVRLQQFPPNLFRQKDQFLGSSNAVAAVPSLSWLMAAREVSTKSNGCSVAWIPTAVSESNSTLGMIAERLSSELESNGIVLDRSRNLPKHFRESQLAIIAAHGSIVPEGQYFQLLADDEDLRIGSSEFARTFRNIRVVVLFVCSGGRTDKHPDAHSTVGLAKQLLDYGCSVVVASPWPLDARVTYHWLPPFLCAWREGKPIIEANFLANKAVDKAFPYEPSKSLAMTVFGNPLIARSSEYSL
jgi:hypothetical protein